MLVSIISAMNNILQKQRSSRYARIQRNHDMAKVILKNIKKIYEHEVVAVQEFNLDIADKEFVVLVGPSGCGKSTTLRMVAGLEEITEGELYIGEKLVNDMAPKDRDIAMVFQNYALYPHMTVYDNMAFSLKLRKTKKTDIDAQVKAAAEILNISELLTRKPKQLSGGQRQRVAIGRAIVRNPKVFLMDEPLSNLDAKLRNQMRAEIIKLRQRIDTTFIYVTHDQTEAMTLGDRIVVMKDGFIQQIGTPQEVYNHPANTFVAGFIGSPQMNFFDACLEYKFGQYAIRLGGDAVIILPEHIQSQLKHIDEKPSDIVIGIRPENIERANHGEPGAICAKADVSEMLGSETFIHFNLNGKDGVIRTATAELTADRKQKLVIGDEFWLAFNGALIHMFDKDSGKNILG